MCLAVQGSALRGLIPRKRGELPRFQDTLRFIFQFRLTAGTLSPGEEGVRNSNVDPSGLDLVIILPRGEERLPLWDRESGSLPCR